MCATPKDHEELAAAAEHITHVIERHRGEDLRILSVFNAAIQDLRIGERYLNASD